MALDLGRVQGASIFHTMAASGTSVSVSSLQPQGFTPFVGDAVQFPNGDVRQITAVSRSTVTLGAVLFSFKGAPGTGNARLYNIDGNSTVDGATQAAIKGILQAKNYYNLAALDTHVSNGNGAGIVGRKTQHLYNFKVTRLIGQGIYDTSYFACFGIYAKDGKIFANKEIVRPSGSWDDERYIGKVVLLGDNEIAYGIAPTSLSGAQEIVNNANLHIQIELPSEYQYEEPVMDNQPIHIADQEENLYWHTEWQKGLNLIKKRTVTKFTDAHFTIDIGNYSSGTYTIYVNSVNATLYIGGFGSGIEPIIVTTPKTFTLSETQKLIIDLYDVYIDNMQIMLVKGSHPYPYEPYYGEIVRQKDLSEIQLFPENVNPAQTIGGDWEDLGTVTVGSTTLHAYQKINGGQ